MKRVFWCIEYTRNSYTGDTALYPGSMGVPELYASKEEAMKMKRAEWFKGSSPVIRRVRVEVK